MLGARGAPEVNNLEASCMGLQQDIAIMQVIVSVTIEVQPAKHLRDWQQASCNPSCC
jgi:hypothetical protein